MKSLPKIGNTEREVDSGYIEDVHFWVCTDYSWRSLARSYKCGSEAKKYLGSKPAERERGSKP